MDAVKVENGRAGAYLFRKIYRKEIDDEVFYHKHYQNPCVMVTPCIIEKKEGKPIGMHWMMRQSFICGDEVFAGVQGSDDALLSEERGGITFLKMRMQSVKVMKEEGTDFEYGCFSKGKPLEIADKFGEKEIVDLFLARLYLKEKAHKWKRFNIPYPEFFSVMLYNNRKQRMWKNADKTLQITTSHVCPFGDKEYACMNAGKSLHAVRNHDFYAWKLGKKPENSIEYVVARKSGQLVGYLILDSSGQTPQIIDWDILCSENREAVLASLIYPCMQEYAYIDIPYLNIQSGEMNLFTKVGCKDMSALWAPACICVKPLKPECTEAVTTPELWKLRLIDADYYLNT